MSQSPSGSDLHRHSIQVQIQDATSVGEARRAAGNICDQLDFNETQRGRASIVVNELGNNLARYAKNGRILLTKTGFLPDGIDIVSIDEGPGLSVEEVMQDGFTTGSTPGTGMGAIQRQSDVFDIFSQPTKGTIVLSRVLRKPTPDAKYEVGAIGLPLKGESVSGDGWLVKESAQGLDILAIDGLGHGPLANRAAVEATDVAGTSIEDNVERTIQLIHGRLKSTRGAAIFLLKANAEMLHTTGVGNIRAIWQSPLKVKNLISQNGTAGVQMRTVKEFVEPWDGSGYLVLHSDGIYSRFSLTDYPGLMAKHPSIVAGLIIRDFCRGTDDATIIVARRNFEN